MSFKSLALAAVTTASVAFAANDPNAHLTKPTIVDNLDYLRPGLLQYLPTTTFTKNQWAPGTIPQGCKNIAQGKVESSIVYDPHDFQVFDITYEDCDTAWQFCHHKDSNITIDSMASQFGRMPIQMRQWIRHVVDVPADNGWAFEWDGDITFVRPVDDMINAIVHETGHSLDLNGAYADKPLSSSDKWWNEYNQDSNVPDGYSQTNAMEDIAQNTVISLFNEIVPGGYGGIEPNSGKIFRQYATIITEARDAGNGNSILHIGESGSCVHNIPASDAVSMDGDSTKRSTPISLRGDKSKHDNHAGCGLTW